MPVKITVKELAARCQVFYRKVYGFCYSEKSRVAVAERVPITFNRLCFLMPIYVLKGFFRVE